MSEARQTTNDASVGLGRRLFLTALRAGLAVLLFLSAWQKLYPANPPMPSGFDVFAMNLASYKIVPEAWVPFVARLVPWAEALCGLHLLTRFWIRGAALLTSLMLLSFTAAVVSVIVRGMNIECGCFGRFRLLCEGPIGWCKVGENALLILASLLLVWQGKHARLCASQCPDSTRSA